MRKHIFCTILAFVLIVFGTIHNAQAQCPLGQTATTLTYGPDANGCSWYISICIRCSIVGGIPTSVTITNIEPVDKKQTCPYPNKTDVLDFIRQNINSYCTIVPCGNPQVPCSTTSDLTIYYPLCWQWHIYGWYEDGYHFSKYLQSCTAGYCQISYKACIDHNTGLIVVCPGSTISYTEINVTCSDVQISEPSNPSPPGPGDLGDHAYATCFKFESCP